MDNIKSGIKKTLKLSKRIGKELKNSRLGKAASGKTVRLIDR